MTTPEPEAYKERVTAAVFKGIVAASMTETAGVRTAAILSGEVSDVLVSTMALLLCGSAECSSPSSTRRVCDAFARKLQQRITAAKGTKADFIQHVQLGAEQ